MYYLTGLPGWIRFGYSPGWVGRSPTGLPPTAQWLMQSGMMPQYMQWLQSQAPMVPPAAQPQAPIGGTPTPAPFGALYTPQYSEEQERQMLEQQVQMLNSQLEAIRKRIEELSKE